MAPKRKLPVGSTLAEVLRIYRDEAGVLLSAAALIFLPLTLLTEIVARDSAASAMAVSLVFSGPAAFIYSALVTPLADPPEHPGQTRAGSLGDLWQGASPFFGQLLLAGLIYSLLTTAGVMLLILPGLILITIWAVAPVTIRLERAGAIESLRRSRELVRGFGLPVFTLVIAVVLLVLAGSVIVQGIAIGIAGEDTGAFVGSWLGVVIAAPMMGLMPPVLYRFLREIRPVERPAEELSVPSTDEGIAHESGVGDNGPHDRS